MRNLDVLSSFVLSRPRSLPKVPSILDGMEGLDTESAFCAMGNGCTLLDDIVDTKPLTMLQFLVRMIRKR